jgi:hypothetical protein
MIDAQARESVESSIKDKANRDGGFATALAVMIAAETFRVELREISDRMIDALQAILAELKETR